ncbi:MAG: MgtC/SapB family protein [Candidatus Omnitrophica bacterium]|nr:MgtC/SapB family protein [Candidatus Omnitrophota bacterium]
METLDIYRLLLAVLFSGLIGLEREKHGRAAGFRTHILVGTASCLLMLTSLYLHKIYGSSADPSRIAAQVVSGIGFLGAGTIIRFRASIKGLTTAASLWAVAGIGLATGAGLYWHSAATTLIILATLYLLSSIENKVLKKSLLKTLQIELSDNMAALEQARTLLKEYGAEIKEFEIKSIDKDKRSYIIEWSLKSLDKHALELTDDLNRISGVNRVRWL